MKPATVALALLLTGCASASVTPPSRAPDLPSATTSTGAARLLLDDEFNGSALDPKLWSTCYSWAPHDGGCSNNPSLELEWYTPHNVRLAGGLLQLVARRRQVVKSDPYTSGMIATGGWLARNGTTHPATFGFLYGYAEIRAKLPRGAGMWPAFWLVPTDRSWPPEIDIMEFQGVAPRIDFVTVHWRDAKGNLQQNGSAVDVHRDLSAGFHTYAVDWEPSSITWYFDGRAIKRFTDARWIAHTPMYPILNLAIGGWLPGQLAPVASSFPATFAVDYIRIWNRKPATP